LNEDYISYLPVIDDNNGNAIAAACRQDSFSEPVSSDIEMRLCRGLEEADEEITLKKMELYVL